MRHQLPYVVLVLATIVVLREISVPKPFGWPPSSDNETARIQIDSLAIEPGDVFKGRSVTLLGMNDEGSISWAPEFTAILLKLLIENNYDTMTDARALGVPVINEYGHWISPPTLALLAAAFYDVRDPIARAAQVPRVYRANLARVMGVALVVSDKPIPGEKKLYEGFAVDHPFYIHEVADTNKGQFSPTRVSIASDAHDILDQLQAPDFDGQRLAVVEAPLDFDLVRAEDITVRLEKGPAIHVTGRGAGTSLLVLPFEFSHCLEASGTGLDRIVPVNLAQIGLVVTGSFSVDIVYRYGLFAGTSCRKRDLERIKALDLEEAAVGRLFLDPSPRPQ